MQQHDDDLDRINKAVNSMIKKGMSLDDTAAKYNVDRAALSRAFGKAIIEKYPEQNLVFWKRMSTECVPDRHVTEKFSIPNNCLLGVRGHIRRPLLRRAGSEVIECILRHAEDDTVAIKAMKEGEGRLIVNKDSFRGKKFEKDMIIQDGGKYYLEIIWKDLIHWWDVFIVAPKP